MLPKKNRIKNKKDFEATFKKGRVFRKNFFILRALKNGLGGCRLAAVISKKVSKKATERNKIRRMIFAAGEKEILNSKNGLDLIFWANPEIKDADPLIIEKEIKSALKKCFIL